MLIKSSMKKKCNQHGCKYGFGGILMRFCRGRDIKEKALDYKLQLEMRPIDVIQIRALDIFHGLVLTLADIYA